MSASDYIRNGAGLAYSSQLPLRLSPDGEPPQHGEMVEEEECQELLFSRLDILRMNWRVNGVLVGISCGLGLEVELVGDLNDMLVEISCELDMELVGDLVGTCMLDMELKGDLEGTCILAEISYELDMELVVEWMVNDIQEEISCGEERE